MSLYLRLSQTTCLLNQLRKICISLVVVLVVTVSFPVSAPAQSFEQTLEDSLKTTVDDSVKISLLNRLAQASLFKDAQRSIEYAEEALTLSKRINSLSGMTQSLNQIGLGFWSKGDLRKSISLLQESLEIAKQNNDSVYVARNIGSQGLIFAAAGMHGTAIAYYKRSLPLYQQLGILERVTASYNNIGKAYLELQQYDSASVYLKMAEETGNKIQIGVSIIPFNLADLYFNIADLDKSLEYLELCREMAARTNDSRSLARYHQLLAEIQLLQNKFAQAEASALIGIQYAEITNSKEVMYITYLTYATALSKQNKFKEAYHYHNLYTQLKDTLTNNSLQNMLILNEYTQKQNEINRLVEQQELLQARENQKITIIISLSVTLLLAVILVYYFAHSRNQRKRMNILLFQKNQEIKEQNEQLAVQTRELSQINSFKNKMLSIISHDLRGPFHSLRSLLQGPLKNSLSTADVNLILDELYKHVNSITALSDTLLVWASNQLQGPSISITTFDVKTILEDEVAHLQPLAVPKDIQVRIDIDPGSTLTSDVNIIRIVVRNLISNAIKFSPPHAPVEIYFTSDTKSCKIAVRDYGAGMPKEGVSQSLGRPASAAVSADGLKGAGVGLLLCKDLIEQLGGRLHFETNEGKGTTFFIEVTSLPSV